MVKLVMFYVVSLFSINVTVLSQGATGKDNNGKEFIFGFMDNYNSPSLEVFITTDNPEVIDVNVSTPLYDSHFLHTFSIRKGHLKKISLPADIRGKDIELGNKGIQIVSTAEVSVYAVNKDKDTTDAYVVFPTDTLGRRYIVMSWPERSAFMIVATKDNTNVNITLSDRGATIIYNGIAYKAGRILTIYLEKWQTFHAYHSTADFSGTYITSNNKIVVLSGNKCVKIGQGACDHTISQMTPVETFGKEFVSISMPNCNSPVSYKIISSEDNTDVNISGEQTVKMSTSREFHTFEIQANSAKVVSSNKPIELAFFAKGRCTSNNLGDPSMILMPPVSQFAADYTFATIEFLDKPFQNSLTIVIRDIYITGLVLDEQHVSALNWRNVEGSDDLKVIDLSINDGSHTVYHVDPTVIFLAAVTGISESNSYAYSAGQRLVPINSKCTKTATIPGDIIDNDCDSFIDEEIQDGKDNDGDGRVDEDLAVFFNDISTSTSVISTEGCPAARLDLVFILDSSTSVGLDNYNKMLMFCKDVIQNADIDSGIVRVGIVSYSTTVNVEFNLNSYSTKTEIFHAIDVMPFRNGSRNIADALRITRTKLYTATHGNRNWVRDVAIILSVGASDINSERTVPEAEQVRASGIHIYAVGIGLQDTVELDAIASPPKELNSFNMQDFDELTVLSKCTSTHDDVP